MAHKSDRLPSTEKLLVSGGDARILLDGASGLSRYGCGPFPAPDSLELSSCTASTISSLGYAAADALRNALRDQLRWRAPAQVYAGGVERLRARLRALCGFAAAGMADSVDIVPAASGTDAHLLATQWLRPHLTLSVAASETGSGIPAALQGRHFTPVAPYADQLTAGQPVTSWESEHLALSPREADGSLRSVAAVDAECSSWVQAAVHAGKRVLLVLTDVSKTGLIVPTVETALALKANWPESVDILVDACQLRLAPATLRAYIERGCILAISGSKFISGPTFSAALLAGPSCAAHHRESVLPAAVGAYSSRMDWPARWAAGQRLPAQCNFGLLLRWEAALAEWETFQALPDAAVTAFLRQFGAAVDDYFARTPCFRPVPVAPLSRHGLDVAAGWDLQATIFPFLLYVEGRGYPLRPMQREETRAVYQALLQPRPMPGMSKPHRIHLGQPVDCGWVDGVPVSALRLCVSAPMAVAACRDGTAAKVIDSAIGALETVRQRLGEWKDKPLPLGLPNDKERVPLA